MVRMGGFFGAITEHGATVFLAAVTGALSFSHIRDLALTQGQRGWQADLYPAAVDAITVAALRKLRDPDVRGGTRALAWVVFVFFCGISVAANLLDSPTHNPLGYFVAVIPSVAFLANTLLGHASSREEAEPQPEVTRETTRRASSGQRAEIAAEKAAAYHAFRAKHPDGTAVGFARFCNTWFVGKGLPERSEGTLRNYFGRMARA